MLALSADERGSGLRRCAMGVVVRTALEGTGSSGVPHRLLGLARPIGIALGLALLGAPALGADPVVSTSPSTGTAATSPPASIGPTPSLPGGFPRCRDVTKLAADPSLYRDEPIYVANEMPTAEVARWARTQPGFEELWIDRDHLGWISVGFSQGAEARQEDIERLFPDDGVVAVAVPVTKRELRRLQRQVGGSLSEVTSSWTTSASVHEGIVEVGVGALTDEVLAFLEERFAGQPLCVDGPDPATLPSPGPQTQKGDGWRLLGADRVGKTYRTGIAWDDSSLVRLWRRSGLPGDPPAVDFEREVAVWFAHVYGSSCPNQRLDDVLVDTERALLYPFIVDPDAPVMCTDDANPFAFVVAVDRAALPDAPFAIQLGPEDPPSGAPRERTIVEADLRQPGAVARPGDVHPDRAHRRQNVLTSGGVVEPGYAQPYRFDVRCGIEWLGEVNGIQWRADSGEGDGSKVPPAWQALVAPDGTMEVSLLLLIDPDPRVEVTAEGFTIGYIPSLERPPACPPA